MKVTFWGTRGSIAVPGESTVRYGGNTSCTSLEVAGRTFIFDAGTGIRCCGNALLGRGGPIKASIFISHTHWDHIQGFPFFIPSYIPGNEFTLYGPPSDVQVLSLQKIMEMQTNYEYFPVRISSLGSTMKYVDCGEGSFEVDGVQIHTCRLNHPIACLAYKVVHDGKTFVYGGDHEPFRNLYRDGDSGEEMDEEFLKELDENAVHQNTRVADFCRDADLVSWDSMYTEEEYQSKIGWGHSYYKANMKFARDAGIRHIVFNHHDPARKDEELDAYAEKLNPVAEQLGFTLTFAREGLSLEF
ncbi:MAG: MBL fold metallo-hydrolase [Planctomycetota bacterium]|jgi:phosphoribosyl 1,2-cyclic phosphodiesterase